MLKSNLWLVAGLIAGLAIAFWQQPSFKPSVESETADRADSIATRVFDIRQLNELALRDRSGESAVVEVRRNGENVGVALPKGPTGILSGVDSRGPAPDVQP